MESRKIHVPNHQPDKSKSISEIILIVYTSHGSDHRKLGKLGPASRSTGFSVFRPKRVRNFRWKWEKLRESFPFILLVLSTMWGPPVLNWFRFTPVTSSLFAYHIFTSSWIWSYVFTPTERYYKSAINPIKSLYFLVVYHHLAIVIRGATFFWGFWGNLDGWHR